MKHRYKGKIMSGSSIFFDKFIRPRIRANYYGGKGYIESMQSPPEIQPSNIIGNLTSPDTIFNNPFHSK